MARAAKKVSEGKVLDASNAAGKKPSRITGRDKKVFLSLMCEVAKAGSVRMAKALLSEAAGTKSKETWREIIGIMLSRGDAKLLRLALSKRDDWPDVLRAGYEIRSALLDERESGLAELAKAGMDLDRKYYYMDCEPIRYAVEKGRWRIVCKLLDLGAGRSWVKKEKGILAKAFSARGVDVVVLLNKLIDAGADPHGVNREKAAGESWTSPLMSAAYFDSVATIKKLISAGADPRVRNAEGRCALSCAVERGQQAAALYLLNEAPPEGKKELGALIKTAREYRERMQGFVAAANSRMELMALAGAVAEPKASSRRKALRV